MEKAYLGGGCFWCLEAAYQNLQGVVKVVSGYAGGQLPNPTYEAVCSGRTGHAEVVEVTFRPNEISFSEILDFFWKIHDPTTKNRQGNDVGTQYRSIILPVDPDQKAKAFEALEKVSLLFEDPIVTEIVEFAIFYPAEDYHQNFFVKNPTQGYCKAVILPKLKKLNLNF